MTAPRPVHAGRTYLVSRRCTQRQFLLRPDPVVEQIYVYCLAEAAQRFDVSLHGFVAMSNHQHVVLRDNHGNYPEFLAHLNKMIAKAMNARHGRWENFWAAEQCNVVLLVDAADRLAKLLYVLANPVAEHLVDRVSDWPGACSLRLHLSGRSHRVRRPVGFFRDGGPMPDEVELRIERPAGFSGLSDSEWVSAVATGVRCAEESAREERRRSGVRVLGRKAVLRANHTDTPTSVARRRALRPHVACRDPERRSRVLAELRDFRRAYRVALERARAGDGGAVFPAGTYRLREVFACEGQTPH
jgi:putative transposase